MDIHEIIDSISEQEATHFYELYQSDKFENIIERKNYLLEKHPQYSIENFPYMAELIMHSACVIKEYNKMLHPRETPHRAIYSLGLDYEYNHPEIVFTNGYLGENESEFELKYETILRMLCKKVFAGFVFEPGIDYNHLLDGYSLQVPLVFKKADFGDISHWLMAFDYKLQDFYYYFTFDSHKISRNYLMPLVLDLTTYTDKSK
jgi:hypothetical protein